MHLAKPYSPAVSEESRSHQPSISEFIRLERRFWRAPSPLIVFH